MVRKGMLGLVLAAVAACAGCAVDKVDTPSPTGPSELALSLQLQLDRDTMPQDGQSTNVLTVLARDGQARPISGVPLRVDTLVQAPNGAWVVADFGAINNRWPQTGSDGAARVTYQAPAKPAPNAPADEMVTFMVTPIGPDHSSAMARTVTLRLVRPGVILPPNSPPVPSFFFSPSSIREDETVLFDGSASTDDGQIVSYVWSFGDGGGGSGQKRTHSYALAGTYLVTLTVTDDRGTSVSTSPVTVAVTAATNPVASFTISPTAPLVGQSIVFNSAPSTVPTGRTLVGFDWEFGDGTQKSGVTATHTYALPGTYTVVLTVYDNTGRKGVTTRTVTVTVPE
jgi:PKD repeat protein